MGRPMPGYPVVLLDPVTGERSPDEGEICLDLSVPILGLMAGYHDDPELTAEACRDGFYHTGDIASTDEEGYLTYVGRADDVFKASDYKISPFELESILLEHPYVTEVAIVPSPDPVRAAVPKAFVCLAGSRRRAGGRGPRHLRPRPAAALRLPAGAHPGVRPGTPQDHLRQDPPRRTPRTGGRPRRRPDHRRPVPGARLPLSRWLSAS